MSEWSLLYGDGHKSLALKQNLISQTLEGLPLPRPASEKELVLKALQAPIDSPPLHELVRPGEKVCIIVSDMTRSWVRHHLLLPPLLDELNRGGVKDSSIFVLCATGDHREQTAAEHETLIGEEAYARVKIMDHRARVKEELIYLGDTPAGTPVSLNKAAVKADRVILTGGIVYHFLAGWGGGKKAIIPGIAAYETIMKNHSLAFNPSPGMGLNPAVRAGVMSGNPCSEDMVQAAGMLAPDFLVNTVINEDEHEIAYVVAGNYITAHRQGCALVDRHFGVTLPERGDLVIASCGGFPKDINLYQAYKTIYNAAATLKKGGSLILVAECREGIGSPDFAEIIKEHGDNAKREAALRERYTIGGQMGYHTAILAEQHQILLLSGLPGAEVRSLGMTPISNLEEGLELVAARHGKIPPACIMPHGGGTLPRVCPPGENGSRGNLTRQE